MKKQHTRTIAGRTFSIEVDAEHDPELGDVVLGSALETAELAMAASLADGGPITGETFAWMRSSLGIQSKQLAALLGVRPETITRWEKDQVPVDRAAWLTLGELVLERVGRPRALRERMERLAG